MRRNRITAILAGTMLATSFVSLGQAQAQAVSGIYVGAGAGINFAEDRRLPAQTARFIEKTDLGYTGVASIGYGFGNGLRAELEGNYRQERIHALSGTRFPTQSGGHQVTAGVMVNALYDLDLGLPVTPYAGVGVGWQHSSFGDVHSYAPGYLLRSNSGHDDVAWQGIAGIAYPVSAVPGLSMTAEYRVRGFVPDNSAYRARVFNNSNTFSSDRLRNGRSDDLDLNHSILLGVRYAFGVSAPAAAAEAPAPVPVAAVAASRTYLVFFDWDRANLTERARAVVAEAASNSQRSQVTRIEVAGHTDSSGTSRYNQGLSERRAQNVASELVRLGVPRASINVQGFGEGRPLVQTAAGVREPQNRRVEIVLR